MISESHSLRQLFREVVDENFSSGVGLHDAALAEYVANMLTEFCDVQMLYQVRNGAGRALTDVGEMLLAADPVYGEAPSFDHEREVRKHIGDFTLFFSGMYPEAINHWRLRRQRLESFLDFMKAGKESYYIVSKFEYFEYEKVAPLFSKLSREFERCVYGLNLVKNDLQERQHPIVRRTQELIM